MIDILRNAFDIAIDRTTQSHLGAADILIEPKVGAFPRNDNSSASLVIAEGYRAAELQIDHIREVMRNFKGSTPPSLWRSLLGRAQ